MNATVLSKREVIRTQNQRDTKMSWNQILVGARHDHDRGHYGERERRERERERERLRREAELAAAQYGGDDYGYGGEGYVDDTRSDPAWLRYQQELAEWRRRYGRAQDPGWQVRHRQPIPSPRPGFHWVRGAQGVPGHWERDRGPRIGAGGHGGGHGGHGGHGGGHHGGRHGWGRGNWGWGGYGYGGYPYGYGYGYPYAAYPYGGYGTEVALGPVAGPWVRRAHGLM
jgi:hypothetical protein